jgi:ribosomal protein S18 acetylase RimI-like enzyme
MPIEVRRITELSSADLVDISQATEDAILDGIGFNWVSPPSPEVMESYWRGVMVVPERELFGGWLDGTLAAAVQLVKPGRSKETSSFTASIEGHFVAPWARGHGLARGVLQAAEREAATLGFSVLRLHVRETQDAAIRLYQENGYIRWGVLPYHEIVNGQMIAGHFFYKRLQPLSSVE